VVLSVCATAQARQQALACHFFLPSAILLPEPQPAGNVHSALSGDLAHYTIDRLLRFLTLLNHDVTIVVGNEQRDQAGALRVRAG